MLISHALRRMQMADKRPLLSSHVLERTLQTETLPPPGVQADNLVRWLGENSPGPGEIVSIALETHGAIIGTANLDGFHFVLGDLKEAGLINWYAVTGSKQSLHLTGKGWRRYEELRAAPHSATASHRHAAILATDMVGYSKMMSADEKATLAARWECISIVRKAVESNSGRLVKTVGDGTLNEFGSTVDAMQAALEILGAMAKQNADKQEGKRVELRLGLAVGDISPEGDDILGDTVNLAARLEATAAPGTIATLEHVRDDLANKLELASEDLGQKTLKGIARQVRVVLITPK